MNILLKPVEAHGSRGIRKPLLIVLHITDGTASSAYNTFKNKANAKSSTFINCRNGEIWQCVPITKAPYTNGNIRNPISSVVRSIGQSVNPNLYSVTIENEGYAGFGKEGDITEDQFWSLVWLIKTIQLSVLKNYGNRIPLNSERVVGHNQIDSVGKPYCPGPKFPWARLYSELAIIDQMDDMTDVEERITALSDSKATRAYAVVARIKQLRDRVKDPKWGASAVQKLNWLIPIQPDCATAEDLDAAVTDYFNAKKYDAVLAFEPTMKQKGLL